MRYRALTIALSAALVVALSGVAVAQSTVCANLASDLAGLDRHAAQTDPYGDAIAKQTAALSRAEADYQHSCSTGLFSQPSPACPAMGERIQAMQTNLLRLQHAAPRGAGRSDDQRARLQALYRQNGCDQSGVITTYDHPAPGILSVGSRPPAAQDPSGQAPFGRTFTLDGPNGPVMYREEPGGRIVALGPVVRVDPQQPGRRSNIISTPPLDEPDHVSTEPSDDDNGPSLSGTYRTLCVRTCDGYYFPISYSATRSQFGTDAEVCKARCPGTETKLFVVKTPGEDGEQSFAPDSGEAYAKLPNALRYRHEVVNACTCGRPDMSLMPLSALPDADRTKAAPAAETAHAQLPIPDPRPPYGEDPETMADLAQDFTPHPIEALAARLPTPDSLEGATLKGTVAPKTVRIIGPKFYADR